MMRTSVSPPSTALGSAQAHLSAVHIHKPLTLRPILFANRNAHFKRYTWLRGQRR